MKNSSVKIQESGEMYLETILILSKKHDLVRSIDISEYRGYSKPSVSRAVSILKTNGYITIDSRSGHIALTESGKQLAEKIYERHQVLTDLLTRLGVDPETAEDDACRIEHVISDTTFECIKQHAREYSK